MKEGTEMAEYTAIQITSPTVFRMACVLDPRMENFEYEELHEQFIVFDYPTKGEYVLVTPKNILNTWDHLEPGMKLKTVRFIK